jgi:hypothetical protein
MPKTKTTRIAVRYGVTRSNTILTDYVSNEGEAKAAIDLLACEPDVRRAVAYFEDSRGEIASFGWR